MEVAKAGRRHIHEALITAAARDARDLSELRGWLSTKGVPLRTGERSELDEVCDGGNHQGVALRVGGYPYISLEQVVHDVKADAHALVLLLDHIEDPQNVGSLLRTADAVGVTAVILPEDRAAAVTPAVVRASAGASEHLRIARVVNLVRAMQSLKEARVWISGLELGAQARHYTSVDLKGRVGVVVGSEGHGMARLTRENCDFLVGLPMQGKVASLNAAIAGAILLYEVLRQRA